MKKTIANKLATRNYQVPSKFITWTWHTLTYFMGKKFNCEYKILDDINKEEGPCVLLFNHLSRFDHIFISQITYPKRINIVCAYNEFFRGTQATLFKFMNVIPKKNFSFDLTAQRAISKIIKSGGTVCFAPEGMTPMDGKNHPIGPGGGHLLKHLNVPVYYIQLEGQFMIASKVCLDERIGGKCSATIKKLFTKEDLAKYSNEEIDDILNNMMRHDEYEWQKEHHYKYDLKGESCKNLHDLCFECPKCHEKFSMVGYKDHIECKKCGNGAFMDDYYDFHPYNSSCVIPSTPSKWCDLERINVIKEIRNNPNFSFSINVELGELPKYKVVKGSQTSVRVGKGKMVFDHEGVHFNGEKNNEPFNFDVSYKGLYTILSALDFSFFDFYVQGNWYDFFPIKGEEGKVGYIQLLVEEMHRLHFNDFKNFKYYDYMYK